MADDIEELRELVSVALVTDPFGNYDERLLQSIFPDLTRPFKQHFVVDLSQAPEQYVDLHHQRNARIARRTLVVERCENPVEALDDWNQLYQVLIARHDIRGVATFSRHSFHQQLKVQGMEVFQATLAGRTVGMLLWYVQDGRAYYHLGAYSDEGYRLRASFALFWAAIEYFADIGLSHLNLGAGAGRSSDGTDGLSRFKSGWSNQQRTAYLCGRVFDRNAYSALAEARGTGSTTYFPAYRECELG